MKRLWNTLLVLLFIVFAASLGAGEIRQLTGSNGKIIEAEVLGLEGDIVKIKLKTGREMNVLLSKFAKKDQELIKQIASTEDPFDDDNAVKDDDPDKFAEPAKVRFTLELSEKGKAKIRIEEIAEPPRNDFGGKPVIVPSIPKLDFRSRPDGMSKLVFDFKEPIPANMPIFKFGDRYDPAKKSLLFEPPEKEPGKFDDGGCLFGLPPGICQLPMTISFGAVVTHRGEWCNMEFIFSDCVFFCHVYSNGKEFADDLEINCRFGTPVAPKNRSYKEVLRMKNVVLDEPFEATFPASQLKGKESEFFRGGIARNLNREEGIEVNRHPLEVKYLSFEGRLTLPPKEK